jgi:hypothetical protein
MTTRKDTTFAPSSFQPSRRDFLKTAALLAGGIGLVGIPGWKPRTATAAVDTRTFSSSRFALELDGQFVDYLMAFEGGFPKAEVIAEPPGPTPFLKKHIGPPKYQDIAIQCSPVLPKPLFDWVAGALNMSPIKKNGAIITAGVDSKEQSRLQFNNAQITEVGFPALDASSKDTGLLTIKFAPEFTTPLAGKGIALPAVATRAKPWLSSNFRLTIPGLDCSRVSKIDAFTIKQPVLAQGQAGQSKVLPAGKLEFPNLAISVAEANAGTFYAWFQDMVLKGNVGENFERPGTLELLDPTMKTVLLTIIFEHLGIFGFTPENAEAGAEKIKRVKVEMYCEQIALK